MKKSEKNGISEIKLVFFCGNPGKEYSNTRHNAAWLLLEQLSRKESLFWQKKFKGSYARCEKTGGTIFLKPEVFMNLAGECLSPAAAFFKLDPENILVCHDDIELEFGTVSIKYSGGNAGHNGLRSIEKMLGTKDYYRFRIGISRPAKGQVDSHVLGRFSSDEEAVLQRFMELASVKLEDFIAGNRNVETGTKIRLLP